MPTAIPFDILHAECSGAGNHHFTLYMNGLNPSAYYVAELEVTVATASGPVHDCLFDGYPGKPNRTCTHQRFCDSTEWSYLALVGGSDPDGDGIVGGLGSGCDTCLASGTQNLSLFVYDPPPPGSGFWYLVDYGSASDGTPRSVQGCP